MTEETVVAERVPPGGEVAFVMMMMVFGRVVWCGPQFVESWRFG